ncbi:MAG: SUMF1/EgtB/PvdO family nonheme iron enzyme [Verrucomicrobia bacterium]|nr:SUMF1/EgtB/PvdO family nonheme iron enzyme [Verrucomicrobiota bacterium]
MRATEISRGVIVGAILAALSLGHAQAADVTFPATVTVGNPGNSGDSTGFGGVPYIYRIGKYEVTNAEYCEFLNAVDKTGAFGFWRAQMGQNEYGGISRSGNYGTYQYSVKYGMEDKPVVLVNWNETLRFCNWLSGGKGKADLDKGAYEFVDEWGVKTVKMPDHKKLAAGDKTVWVLSSENEWYKAAYYDPEKSGGQGGYWAFPTRSNNMGNASLGNGGPSEVGAYKNAASAYGTFDQGGNVWEWNETKANGNCGVRGGSYWLNDNANYARSSTRYVTNPPEFIYDNYGFRVVALGGAASK